MDDMNIDLDELYHDKPIDWTQEEIYAGLEELYNEEDVWIAPSGKKMRAADAVEDSTLWTEEELWADRKPLPIDRLKEDLDEVKKLAHSPLPAEPLLKNGNKSLLGNPPSTPARRRRLTADEKDEDWTPEKEKKKTPKRGQGRTPQKVETTTVERPKRKYVRKAPVKIPPAKLTTLVGPDKPAENVLLAALQEDNKKAKAKEDLADYRRRTYFQRKYARETAEALEEAFEQGKQLVMKPPAPLPPKKAYPLRRKPDKIINIHFIKPNGTQDVVRVVQVPDGSNFSNVAIAHAAMQQQQQQQQQQQRAGGPFIQAASSQGMPSPSPGGVSAAGQVPQQQAAFVNSPGSQTMMHRPSGSGVSASGLSPYTNQMSNVPSPSTNLNTPMAPTPSPRNTEDQACFEKIKELKKYTDLLQRMIAKIGNEDMEKSSKMKRLLEILTNPNQRVSMEILLKCEVALKKMERQHDTGGGVLGPSSVPPSQPKDQTSPFQQIQDAVLSSLKNGSSSHTFLRTFRQSVEALTGQPFATSPDPSESETDGYFDNELSLDIPGVLRRELKIVDNRFKVKVIKNPRSSLKLVIHVSLMEPRLPRVPPLKINIPHDYPDESPSVLDLQTEYGGSAFLTSVARTLKSRILNLPQRFTVLELLRNWEMSVRQVSNPNYKANTEARKALSNGLALSFLVS